MIVSAFVSMVVLNFLAEASSLLKIGTDVQALEIDVNKKPRHRYRGSVSVQTTISRVGHRLLRWFASSKPSSGKSARPRSARAIASANPPIDQLRTAICTLALGRRYEDHC